MLVAKKRVYTLQGAGGRGAQLTKEGLGDAVKFLEVVGGGGVIQVGRRVADAGSRRLECKLT